MQWVLIGVAGLLAYRIFSRKTAPAGQETPTATAPPSFDTDIETKARLREIDYIADAQAKFNLQRRFDLLAKAHDAANPEAKPAPKS